MERRHLLAIHARMIRNIRELPREMDRLEMWIAEDGVSTDASDKFMLISLWDVDDFGGAAIFL
jgi:hypothetical protein